MASSAPKIAEQERRESASAIDQKAQVLVEQIRKSKHFIAFTGAGISTSAGIPDFRGPEGVWTLKRQGRVKDLKAKNTLQAIPTATHMALVELQRKGILKYLVSQNCDGLHRKSGIGPEGISELHGNSNREYCKDCGKKYIRDFRAVAPYTKTVHDHRTGRKCTVCNGVLLDSIINFGEQLDAQPLARARQHAKKADLCLVLGSSLTVPPACTIPEIVRQRKGAKLAICNLQSTPIDELADLRVYSEADELMKRVMEKLGLSIPPFVLHRRLIVSLRPKQERYELAVEGIDVDGTPMTFLQSVKLEGNRRIARSEPFVITGRREDLTASLKIELEFMGHYGEPNLELEFEYNGKDEPMEELYLLAYDPYTGQWEMSLQGHEDATREEQMQLDEPLVVAEEDDSSLIMLGSNDVPEGLKATPTANVMPDVVAL